MRVHIDRDRCGGIGVCQSLAPEVFELDDEGDVQVRVDSSRDVSAEIAAAVEGCPAQALSVVPG